MITQIVACCAWCGAHLTESASHSITLRGALPAHALSTAHIGPEHATLRTVSMFGMRVYPTYLSAEPLPEQHAAATSILDLIPSIKNRNLMNDMPIGLRKPKAAASRAASDELLALVPRFTTLPAVNDPEPSPVAAPKATTPVKTWTGPSAAAETEIAPLGFVSGDPANSPSYVDTEGKGGPASDPKKNPENAICSINVSGAKVSDVVSQLTDMTHVNLVLVAPSDATVTLHMTNVRLIDIVKNVCIAASLKYLKIDDALVIGTADKLKEGYPDAWKAAYPEPPKPTDANAAAAKQPDVPAVIQSVSLSYAEGNVVVQTLKNIFGTDTKLSFSAAAITTGPSGGANGSTQSSGASQVSAPGSANGGAVGGTTGSVGYSKLVILRGPQDLVDSAVKIIRDLDLPARQVMIYVKVDDVDDSAAKDLGLTWTPPSLSFNERTTTNGSPGSFALAPVDIVANIQALEKKGTAKSLAAPNILCLDNSPGSTMVGGTLKFPSVVGFTPNNQPIFQVLEQPVGITLNVRPNISNDGHVMLWVNPQVSAVTSFINFNGGQLPQLSTKEVQTTMELRDGETIAIGGLIDDEMTKSMQKFPILGDIPIIGELFRSRSTSHTRSQVIVTVTAHIVPRTS